MTFGTVGLSLAVPPGSPRDNYAVFQPFASVPLFSWFPSISTIGNSADTQTLQGTLGALSAQHPSLPWGALPWAPTAL